MQSAAVSANEVYFSLFVRLGMSLHLVVRHSSSSSLAWRASWKTFHCAVARSGVVAGVVAERCVVDVQMRVESHANETRRLRRRPRCLRQDILVWFGRSFFHMGSFTFAYTRICVLAMHVPCTNRWLNTACIYWCHGWCHGWQAWSRHSSCSRLGFSNSSFTRS